MMNEITRFYSRSKKQTLILFSSLSRQQNDLTYSNRRYLNPKLETHFFPFLSVSGNVAGYHLLGQKQQLYSNIIVVVNFFLCIHQLSSFHVLAISAERQFDLDLRSEGIQREIRGSGWRMGGDTRQQGQVQCCDNALSLHSRQLLCLRLTGEGESVIHS